MTQDLKLTYYQLLGIPPQAQPSEIETVYKNLVQRFHPDHLPPDTSPSLRERAKAEFARIEAAYQTLRDPLRRKAYDLSLSLEAEEPEPARQVAPLAIPQEPPRAAGQDWLFGLVLLVGSCLGLALLISVIPGLVRSASAPPAEAESAPPLSLTVPETDPAAPPLPPAPVPDPLGSTLVSREQIQKWVSTVEELRPLYSQTAQQLQQTQDPEEQLRLQDQFETAAQAVIAKNGLTPEQYRLISQLARENPQVQQAIRSLRP
ncbi:MAG: DnaJ domain-containing protein [Thermostichales cyanobacterium BF4_bins_65]